MSFWDKVINPLRDLFRPGPAAVLPGNEGLAPLLRPRVLLITFDPSMRNMGGKKLSEALGWRSAKDLCRDFIADLFECSGGYLQYEIVEQVEVNAWPVKGDGFCYDENSFLECWRSKTGWHDPDTVDYEAVYQLVHDVVTSSKFYLIEALAGKILRSIFKSYNVEFARVILRKPNAPIKGVLDAVEVEISRSRDEMGEIL